MKCPECSNPALAIVVSLEMGPDRDSDEVTAQLFQCGCCGLRAAGAYEESRRGSLDSDCWRHYAQPMEPGPWDDLRACLEACPDPWNARCPCAGHQLLRQHDESGRWLGFPRS